MKIDFKNDSAEFLGMTVDLITTKTGNYALPITASCTLFLSATKNNDYNDQKLIDTANTILSSSFTNLSPHIWH